MNKEYYKFSEYKPVNSKRSNKRIVYNECKVEQKGEREVLIINYIIILYIYYILYILCI